MKTALACLMLIASPAVASNWGDPPRAYVQAGEALDRLRRVAWEPAPRATLQWLCSERDLLACAIMWPDGRCTVYYSENGRAMRNHELAHCGGWRHD